MTRIVAVSGSRSADSTTRAALSVALDAAADAGAETGMIDLGTVDLPLYHPAEDVQGDSERLTRLVREADGVLAGTPVYHGSYSSTFKNFHDFCGSDEYENTAVGLLATAGGGSYGGRSNTSGRRSGTSTRGRSPRGRDPGSVEIRRDRRGTADHRRRPPATHGDAGPGRHGARGAAAGVSTAAGRARDHGGTHER